MVAGRYRNRLRHLKTVRLCTARVSLKKWLRHFFRVSGQSARRRTGLCEDCYITRFFLCGGLFFGFGTFAVVVAQRVFGAPSGAEGGDALQVADDARAVVNVARAAGAARGQGALVDVVAFVADGDAHVDAEVVAAGVRGDVEQFAVAFLAERFVEVQMQRRAAVQPVDEFAPVQDEFVERVGALVVFDEVEVGVVAVAWHAVAVAFVPGGVFYAEVFCRHEFGVVAHAVMRARPLVGVVDGFQFFLDEGEVGGVVADGDALRFGGFCHAVDADGEVLLVEGDEARVINGEHPGGKVVFHQFAVGVLVAVDFFHFGQQIAPVLHEAVHVDSDDVD